MAGICLKTKTLPEQANAIDTLTVECSITKAIQAKTAQDTKPAIQSQATDPVVGEEIQRNEIAVPLLRQTTTGTQTKSGDSFREAEILKLKETLSGETSSNAPIETTSFGQYQPKDIRVRRKSRRKDSPEILTKDARTEPDLWTVLPFA